MNQVEFVRLDIGECTYDTNPSRIIRIIQILYFGQFEKPLRMCFKTMVYKNMLKHVLFKS